MAAWQGRQTGDDRSPARLLRAPSRRARGGIPGEAGACRGEAATTMRAGPLGCAFTAPQVAVRGGGASAWMFHVKRWPDCGSGSRSEPVVRRGAAGGRLAEGTEGAVRAGVVRASCRVVPRGTQVAGRSVDLERGGRAARGHFPVSLDRPQGGASRPGAACCSPSDGSASAYAAASLFTWNATSFRCARP